MSTKIDLKGKTALVTGASSGIGENLARQLAARGADLILVARRQELLQALASELSSRHKINARALAHDLSTPDAAATLHARTEGEGQRVDLLMNNAGFGTHGYFLDIPWETTAQQLQLNIAALTELAFRFGRSMRERRQGWILNVASIGAYTPSPTYATYSATKAYVLSFSEALTHELRGSGVQVTCVCPGGTVTGFHQVAGHQVSGSFASTFMTAERCAELALDALFAGRRNVITGLSTKLMALLFNVLPRSITIPATKATMGEPARRLSSGTPKS